MPVEIVKLSKLVEDILGGRGNNGEEVELPNVKAATLSKVIEYCTHYKTVEESKCIFFAYFEEGTSFEVIALNSQYLVTFIQ